MVGDGGLAGAREALEICGGNLAAAVGRDARDDAQPVGIPQRLEDMGVVI